MLNTDIEDCILDTIRNLLYDLNYENVDLIGNCIGSGIKTLMWNGSRGLVWVTAKKINVLITMVHASIWCGSDPMEWSDQLRIFEIELSNPDAIDAIIEFIWFYGDCT